MDEPPVFGVDRPVVGMVHLPPLPGAPGFDGDREAIRDRAHADATALEAGGVDGVIVENFGDVPFYPDDVPDHVVAEFTAVAATVADAVDVPVGVNVLRNDATAALGIAAAVGGAFVRVNVHMGARVSDQGILEGTAHETLRLRERLATSVRIFADVDVKHSSPLAAGDAGRSPVAELVERGLADAVIVSGQATGEATGTEDVAATVEAIAELSEAVPVFVGSGVTVESVHRYVDVADGVIVGTALKEDGKTSNPVDRERVEALVAAAERE